MSGIFGIIHRDGKPVAPANLERMRDAMAHRGPDGSEIRVDGEVGLGQLMLCSTLESLDETLPWKDPESGLVITADARLDNRGELKSKLPVGADSSAIPDSQLILAAYKRWGEACVDHLLGDFAFAIWDPRRKRLFCARDRMGASPFCYVEKDHYIAFASEPEALLRLPGVAGRPNENLVAHIFVPAFENRGDDRSWYRDVRVLMPVPRAQCL